MGHIIIKIEADEETRKEPGTVVALRDGFRTVLQPAIPNKEVIAAARQVERMHAGDSAEREQKPRFRAPSVRRVVAASLISPDNLLSGSAAQVIVAAVHSHFARGALDARR